MTGLKQKKTADEHNPVNLCNPVIVFGQKEKVSELGFVGCNDERIENRTECRFLVAYPKIQ